MFPFRQHFRPMLGLGIKVISSRTLENGLIENYVEDLSKIVLPDAENYRLDVLLKAGVIPERVNCKLISKSAVSVSVDDDTASVESAKNDKEN